MSLLKHPSLRRPNAYTLWSIASILLMGIMVACIIGSSYYIYDRVNRTLTDANTIVILNSAARVDDVNIVGFEKAKTAIASKTETSTVPTSLRNIFVFVSTTPPNYATSSTSTFPVASTTKK